MVIVFIKIEVFSYWDWRLLIIILLLNNYMSECSFICKLFLGWGLGVIINFKFCFGNNV